eukprot:NODE_4362_length_1901_cov_8.321871.p1 GENE.NODE_4362_length_1901_cov_8.321871~~NODE_4362_length_1901_cov_8.321871.p1  ORF type:complete len:412 (+),score=44.37 NODE_4362_length_1901_cov_8.321871:225-1460(+)
MRSVEFLDSSSLPPMKTLDYRQLAAATGVSGPPTNTLDPNAQQKWTPAAAADLVQPKTLDPRQLAAAYAAYQTFGSGPPTDTVDLNAQQKWPPAAAADMVPPMTMDYRQLAGAYQRFGSGPPTDTVDLKAPAAAVDMVPPMTMDYRQLAGAYQRFGSGPAANTYAASPPVPTLDPAAPTYGASPPVPTLDPATLPPAVNTSQSVTTFDAARANMGVTTLDAIRQPLPGALPAVQLSAPTSMMGLAAGYASTPGYPCNGALPTMAYGQSPQRAVTTLDPRAPPPPQYSSAQLPAAYAQAPAGAAPTSLMGLAAQSPWRPGRPADSVQPLLAYGRSPQQLPPVPGSSQMTVTEWSEIPTSSGISGSVAYVQQPCQEALTYSAPPVGETDGKKKKKKKNKKCCSNCPLVFLRAD